MIQLEDTRRRLNIKKIVVLLAIFSAIFLVFISNQKTNGNNGNTEDTNLRNEWCTISSNNSTGFAIKGCTSGWKYYDTTDNVNIDNGNIAMILEEIKKN